MPPPARRLLLAKLALFVPVVVAAFVLHLSGTALVIMHVVRIALIAAVVFAGGWLRSRAVRRGTRPSD